MLTASQACGKMGEIAKETPEAKTRHFVYLMGAVYYRSLSKATPPLLYQNISLHCVGNNCPYLSFRTAIFSNVPASLDMLGIVWTPVSSLPLPYDYSLPTRIPTYLQVAPLTATVRATHAARRTIIARVSTGHIFSSGEIIPSAMLPRSSPNSRQGVFHANMNTKCSTIHMHVGRSTITDLSTRRNASICAFEAIPL